MTAIIARFKSMQARRLETSTNFSAIVKQQLLEESVEWAKRTRDLLDRPAADGGPREVPLPHLSNFGLVQRR